MLMENKKALIPDSTHWKGMQTTMPWQLNGGIKVVVMCWFECLDADAWISVYRDNEGLWREISDLRQKHSQQQQIIKKVQKTFFAPNYFTYSVEIELETIFSQ